MNDVGSKLLGGIKRMYEDNSASVRVKGSKSEQFGLDSGVR